MSDFARDVELYFDELNRTQTDLARLYARKRTALRDADAQSLLDLSGDEQVLARRLRDRSLERTRLLERATADGLPAESLTLAVTGLDAATRSRLEARIADARATTAILRRESWVHWIVANRARGHYAKLTELIAHHGESAPTYSPGSDHVGEGGVVLDAAA